MSMANSTRPRGPILETQLKTQIRNRLMELLGLVLIFCAFITSTALYSYSPNDPNFLNSTSGDVQNIMGFYGASYAMTLMFAIGWASWACSLAMIIWGFRLLLHRGHQLILKRGVFLPIFLAFTAVFMATNVPPANWPNSYNLGGFSGDAIFEVLVDFNPIDLAIWVKSVSLFLGISSFCIGLFSLGFSLPEIKSILSRSLQGVIFTVLILWKIIKKLIPHSKNKSALLQTDNDQLDSSYNIGIQRYDNIEDDTEVLDIPKNGGLKSLLPSFTKFNKNEKNNSNTEILDDISPDSASTDNPDRVTRRIQEAVHRKNLKNNRDAPMVDIEPIDEPSVPTPPDANFYDDANERSMELPLETKRKEPTLLRPSSAKSVVEHPSKKPIPQSKKAKSEAQPTLFSENMANYEQPALDLLESPKTVIRQQLSDEALEENARMLENVLDDYGVKGEIISVRPGPVVTMYELEPAPGLKASRVIGLADDIARSMSALAARVSTVPGRTVIGIELPNDHRETVLLREILSARDYGDGKHGLPLALGKNIGGIPEVADLAKMPHLLIAGTTGSGKSVAINTMLLSLLYKLSPDECRMIMIDPKMLELSVYDGIPHLLSPVVTDPRKAVVALKWVVGEMEERYRKMSKMGVRNISGYNSRVADALAKNEDFERTVQTGFDDNTGEAIFETETFKPEKLPFIVVVVDEMADLMMVAGKEIEACIQRLAQMARASGIHLIMATQRPSVDVITGTIKANFPTRISFQVTSKIDSRTILGEMGAEQLLGMGDMLYMAGGGKITRIHAPFVSDEEVELIVNHLKKFGPPEYVSGVVKGPDEEKASGLDSILGLGGNTDKESALYDQAVAIVAHDRKCSTSYIQRKLSIGYNKAAKIVEEMEDNGIVSAANHIGKREIFLPEQN
ncbi:DNA translocase FtsK 4TM domain-containing protein [Amylibacter sp.]|nr:DNA translocase FtsK 4TM domain-containing protein [Amylibacter sp.]MDC0607289.1 DNA translocase FtsK 4TM domain-containing protein [Amylibacter sp.]